MRLLDLPIRKTAELTNQQAILRVLAGTAAGATGGLLGELMLTGKLGWKGAAAGGALGAGAGLLLDPAVRARLTTKLRKQPEQPEQYTPRQVYETYKEMLANDQVPPQHMDEVQGYIAAFDKDAQDIQLANQFYKDPKIRAAMRYGSDDSTLMQGLGLSKDVGLPMVRYMGEYKRATGKDPDPEHLVRFAQDTRKGLLDSADWGSYMNDTHELSGMDRGAVLKIFPQPVGNWAIRRIMPKQLTKLMQTAGGRQLLRKALGKGTLPAALTGVGGVIGTKGVGKMVAKSAPGLNLLLDIPEQFINPKTGDLSLNVFNNWRQADKLMEIRERGADIAGGDRTTLYNMGAGGITGYSNQISTLGISGMRAADTGAELLDVARRRGIKAAGKAAVDTGSALAGDAVAATRRGADYYADMAGNIVNEGLREPGGAARMYAAYASGPTPWSWGVDRPAPTKQELQQFIQRRRR